MIVSETTAAALVGRWMRKLLQGELSPRKVEHRLWRISSKASGQASELLASLLVMWGRFAQPGEWDRGAEQMMHRAAHGWLALKLDDHAARAAYLDWWIHEELGFRRRLPKAGGRPQGRPKLKSPLVSELPKHGGDTYSARKLVALGYPALAPVLPQLFRWLETSGSAVELVLRPFFAELGAPARDLADEALRRDTTPALKHCLLRHILPNWPREVVATLPLERYLHDSDALGLDIWALKLMMAKRIPTHDGLQGLAEIRDWKIARLEDHLRVLASLQHPSSSTAS